MGIPISQLPPGNIPAGIEPFPLVQNYTTVRRPVSDLVGGGSIASLADVALTGPTLGQALVWNGARWTNTTIATGATSFSQLSDVTLSGLNGGDNLAWDSTNQVWKNVPPGTGITLGSLADISLLNPVAGQNLTWNGTDWVNQAPATYTLATLPDVLLTGQADGNLLAWNASISRWVNVVPRTVLSDLDDIVLTTPPPNTDQVLTWNGTNWTNQDLPPQRLDHLLDTEIIGVPPIGAVLTFNGTYWVWMPGDIDKLTNVNILDPQPGQVLTYDGTNWVNADLKAVTEISSDDPLYSGLILTPDPIISTGTIGVDWTQVPGLNRANTWTQGQMFNFSVSMPGGIFYGDGSGCIGVAPNRLCWDASGTFTLPSAFPVTLGDLTDVTITSPLANQVLIFNGTDWVNQDLSGLGGGVTEVSVGAGLTGTPNPITTSGGIQVDWTQVAGINRPNNFTVDQRIGTDTIRAGLAANSVCSMPWLEVRGEYSPSSFSNYAGQVWFVFPDGSNWKSGIIADQISYWFLKGRDNRIYVRCNSDYQTLAVEIGVQPYPINLSVTGKILPGIQALGDVGTMTPANGDFLGWNGTRWINIVGSSVGLDIRPLDNNFTGASNLFNSNVVVNGYFSASTGATMGGLLVCDQSAQIMVTPTQQFRIISDWQSVPQNNYLMTMNSDGSGAIGPTPNQLAWTNQGRFYTTGAATLPGGGGAGIPEAPVDGVLYGRQDAAWEPITGGGGGGSTTLAGLTDVNLGSLVNGQALVWSSPNSNWTNSASAVAMLGAANTFTGSNIFNNQLSLWGGFSVGSARGTFVASNTGGGEIWWQTSASAVTWAAGAAPGLATRWQLTSLNPVATYLQFNTDGSGRIGGNANYLSWDTTGAFALNGTATLPGGGGASLSTPNTWTAPQTFNNPSGPGIILQPSTNASTDPGGRIVFTPATASSVQTTWRAWQNPNSPGTFNIGSFTAAGAAQSTLSLQNGGYASWSGTFNASTLSANAITANTIQGTLTDSWTEAAYYSVNPGVMYGYYVIDAAAGSSWRIDLTTAASDPEFYSWGFVYLYIINATGVQTIRIRMDQPDPNLGYGNVISLQFAPTAGSWISSPSLSINWLTPPGPPDLSYATSTIARLTITTNSNDWNAVPVIGGLWETPPDPMFGWQLTFNQTVNVGGSLSVQGGSWLYGPATIGNLRGVTSATNAAAGAIGEWLSAINSGTVSADGGQNTTIVSLALTAGDWDVTFHGNGGSSGGTGPWNVGVQLVPDPMEGPAASNIYWTASAWTNFNIGPLRFRLTSAQTITCQLSNTSAPGNLFQVGGSPKLRARRVR
jgi:hypothetical protein